MAIIGIGIKVYKMGAYLMEITELEDLVNILGTSLTGSSDDDSSATCSSASDSYTTYSSDICISASVSSAACSSTGDNSTTCSSVTDNSFGGSSAASSFVPVTHTTAPASPAAAYSPLPVNTCYANNHPAGSVANSHGTGGSIAAGRSTASAGDASHGTASAVAAAGTSASGITQGKTTTADAAAAVISDNAPGSVIHPGTPAVHAVRPKGKKQPASCLFLTNSRNVQKVLELAGISFEGEINLRKVGFSKVEPQQECIWGSLYIPNMVDVMGTKHRIIFFINRQHIVIVDDYDFTARVIGRIRSKRTHQADTKGKFLYNFLTDIINKDLMTLAVYEKNLIAMEERVVQERMQNYQNTLVPMRNELLILQEYYDELRDLGKELEEDANRFFDKNQRKYFGVFSDRADRLMNKSGQLLEYAKQIKDDYETTITARQNTTMQFLTIISTIFMPLTLITSWYGMNFENMPELENGYPFVIALSLIVIAITLIIFRYKKLL